MIVPVVVGPLAGHANSLSAPLQRPIRSVQIKRGIEPPVLSYILQRPIRSVQYCEYVLYRMYYRYHTERRNSLSAPHLCFPTYYRGPFVASNIATQELPLGSASPVLGVMREGLNHLCLPTYYRGPFVASKYCESTPRSQVNLSHDSSRSRRAVGRACELPLGSATEAHS